MASGPPFNGDKPRWSESKVYSRKTPKPSGGGGSKKTLLLPSSQNSLASIEDDNLSQQQQHLTRLDAASNDSSSLNRRQIGRVDLVTGNHDNNSGIIWNRIKINISSRSKQELRDLRRKLTGELTQVRNLVKKLEAKELQLNSSVGNGGLKRVSSDAPATGTTRPLNQLSISVMENRHGRGSDVVEKEKRTPKANQFYRNFDFLLAKDKFPPPDSSKKLKSYSGKKGGGSEGSYGFGMDKQSSQIFKSCNALLGKLMKHKHGWVFNTSVDKETWSS